MCYIQASKHENSIFFSKEDGFGKKRQSVKDTVLSLKVFPPHLKQVCLERGLFSGGSFEPRTFFLVRRKKAYFYLSFSLYEPTGSLAVLPWSRRDCRFKGIPVHFSTETCYPHQGITLPLCSMCFLNAGLLLDCRVFFVALALKAHIFFSLSLFF